MYETQTIRQTAAELKTDIKTGLDEKEAGKRLKKNGFNELKDDRKKSVLTMILEQLNEPLIYVLLGAAAASLFLNEVSDTFIILAVVAMNAVVGVIQEGKAMKALEALKRLSSPPRPCTAGWPLSKDGSTAFNGRGYCSSQRRRPDPGGSSPGGGKQL